MAWAEIHWRSELIDKETTMQVLLPDGGKPPYATLYLLHSLKDDSYAWLRRTQLEQAVRDIPLIVVMPDGYRGFFTDNNEGPPYAKHIGEEVVAYVDRFLPTIPNRSKRGIGGASMGGFGALRVGLGYPDTFSSIHSHAAPLARDAEFRPGKSNDAAALKNRTTAFIAEMHRVFGDRIVGSTHDVLELALRAEANKTLPQIWIDCGLDDQNLPQNQRFSADLGANGIPHFYREFAGRHGWDYCNDRLADALAFHSVNLGLTSLSR